MNVVSKGGCQAIAAAVPLLPPQPRLPRQCQRPSHPLRQQVRADLTVSARSGFMIRCLPSALVPDGGLCMHSCNAATPAYLDPSGMSQDIAQGLQDVGSFSTGHQRTSPCHARRVLAALWAGTGVYRFSSGQDRKFRVSPHTLKSTLRQPRTLDGASS